MQRILRVVDSICGSVDEGISREYASILKQEALNKGKGLFVTLNGVTLSSSFDELQLNADLLEGSFNEQGIGVKVTGVRNSEGNGYSTATDVCAFDSNDFEFNPDDDMFYYTGAGEGKVVFPAFKVNESVLNEDDQPVLNPIIWDGVDILDLSEFTELEFGYFIGNAQFSSSIKGFIFKKGELWKFDEMNRFYHEVGRALKTEEDVKLFTQNPLAFKDKIPCAKIIPIGTESSIVEIHSFN